MTLVSDTSATAVARSDSAKDPGELASTGLLSFYDRLRGRVTRWVDRRSGRLGKGAAEALLIAPDLFILIARLCLDSDVILAAAVLKTSLNSHIAPMAESYWSGSQGLRVALGDLSEAAYGLLGAGLYSRLRRLLDRRSQQA
ncbi:MAG: hypothetical protein P8Y44_03220 [Acidobacteriota bacterium]